VKFNAHKKEYVTGGVSVIFIVIIWSIVLWAGYGNQVDNKNDSLNAELKKFEGEVYATLKTYEVFSNYIYDEIEQDDEILSIMNQANNATDHEKSELREELFNRLNTKYETIKKYDFKQLHFHLPTTESFLRMHAPEKYGDLLADVRESVRLANENEGYVVGFEEGRIFNAFRCVYPLQYNNSHVGTVEVSIASSSILEVLSKLYPEEDFHFIIDKSVVDETVFDSEKDNYSNALISDLFYIDKEVEQIIATYNKIVPSSEEEFYIGLSEKYTNDLKGNESFIDIYKFSKIDYLVKFLAIKNLKEQTVAYMVSISETTNYRHLEIEMYKQMFLVIFLAIFIIGFGFMLTLYQIKFKNASELDQLTKLKDITVSIGVAMIDYDKYDIELALKNADEAMYQAKKNNRNQVCCYDD